MQQNVVSVPRLAAPAHLSRSLRGIWYAVTSALPAEWFGPEQAPLLERYCYHVERSRQMEAILARSNPLKNATVFCRLARAAAAETRTVATLARSMRLTQQSRMRAETAARSASRNRAQLRGGAALHALENLNDGDNDE